MSETTAQRAERLVRELAEMDPIVAQGPNDDESCFFCAADKPYGKDPEDVRHEDDCLWAQARGEV